MAKTNPKTVEQQSDFTLSKLYMWVKGLETKVNTLTREVNLIKNDFISQNKDMRHEIKSLSEDLLEFRHEQESVLQKMDLIIKELKQTAGSEEVDTLKKYMDFWNPLEFVTQRDLERVLDAKLRDMKTHSASSTPNKKH